MTSLRNIEPKLVVKLQPFGTERDIAEQNGYGTLSKIVTCRSSPWRLTLNVSSLN